MYFHLLYLGLNNNYSPKTSFPPQQGFSHFHCRSISCMAQESTGPIHCTYGDTWTLQVARGEPLGFQAQPGVTVDAMWNTSHEDIIIISGLLLLKSFSLNKCVNVFWNGLKHKVLLCGGIRCTGFPYSYLHFKTKFCMRLWNGYSIEIFY